MIHVRRLFMGLIFTLIVTLLISLLAAAVVSFFYFLGWQGFVGLLVLCFAYWAGVDLVED